jgi:hypothetical protein
MTSQSMITPAHGRWVREVFSSRAPVMVQGVRLCRRASCTNQSPRVVPPHDARLRDCFFPFLGRLRGLREGFCQTSCGFDVVVMQALNPDSN